MEVEGGAFSHRQLVTNQNQTEILAEIQHLKIAEFFQSHK